MIWMDYQIITWWLIIRQQSIRMIPSSWAMKEIQTMSIWSGAGHRTVTITCWKIKIMCTLMD